MDRIRRLKPKRTSRKMIWVILEEGRLTRTAKNWLSQMANPVPKIEVGFSNPDGSTSWQVIKGIERISFSKSGIDVSKDDNSDSTEISLLQAYPSDQETFNFGTLDISPENLRKFFGDGVIIIDDPMPGYDKQKAKIYFDETIKKRLNKKP